MDLAQQAKIVDSIHDTLHDFVGQRLKVRANMGRSKIVESEGVLTQVHPQLFIMEVDRKRGRTARQSYQYVDVLTGMVELSQSRSRSKTPTLFPRRPKSSSRKKFSPKPSRMVQGGMPRLVRGILVFGAMVAARLRSRLRYCVDDLSISGFDLTICATSVIIYRRAKSAKPVGM